MKSKQLLSRSTNMFSCLSENISIVIGEESSGFKALLYGLRFYSQFT